MAQTYIDMLPPFVPEENTNISGQKQFYDLIKGLYQLAFDEPLLFVPALHEDDAYPNRFNRTPYGKPELQKSMKKFTKAVDALLLTMFQLSQGNNRQIAILSRLGIEDYTNLPPAWSWMANREGANITAFTHCLFRRDYPYASDVYARLLGEAGFKKLENWMLAKGYGRFDMLASTESDCKLALTIANPKWGAGPPSGGFLYKIKHTGISVRYDYYAANPAVLGLCIPGGLKPYLQAFDAMDKELQAFVVKHTTKCWGCNYCVQTDKTGKRPKAYIPIQFENEGYKLCTYFPGYSFCWTHIDDALADELIRMLSFMDRFAPS